MANEIEKKYRLTAEQILDVLETLKEIGAKYEGEDFEENVIFTNDELIAARAILRLRRIGERTILTYKQRVENDTDVKEHIEHETEIADFETAANIFESLGFHRSLVYEKRRRKWRFRAVEIVLDQLPFGWYMEIEGAVTAIAEAEMFIGAEDFEVEHETYPRLTIEFGARRGGLIEARF